MNNMIQFDSLFSLYVAKNSTFNYTLVQGMEETSPTVCFMHAHN